MTFMKAISGAVVAACFATATWAETPTIRAAVLKFGTVNWEMNTIKHHGFDTANGFNLEVDGVAGSAAAQIAFQAGETDVIVSDWLWVARQRAAGKDFVFIPYSKAVGGIMVPGDSTAQNLSDLAGLKVGIAGGPLDKSWLILQAYAEKNHDMNLADDTEQVFGAPPLIFGASMSGELDAAINFWHFGAKMEAGGMRTLVSVEDAAIDLGLDPETPLLGYVVHGEMLRDHPDLVNGLTAASRAAKDLLTTDDAEWDRLRENMNANDDAQFAALVAGFRAGIPAPGPIDEDAASRMLTLMYDLGGAELLGDASELPAGTFVQSGS
ncbi:NitT/TauT family transport system substrate-binding protein [Loktanella ponticola]|uniref:NitT/TauT family transport system substrate-binding protein n=1 Tax=Yoonia ponticola TaxID=1524255 RepID=A0A7W9BKY9_9RHOB|nr:NitT/TauT family transport system substrate-binding protein [Yoonia ponticola]